MPKDTTNGKGHNISALKKQISEGVQAIKQHKADRKSSNGEIAAVRATLEANGIPKKVLAAVEVFTDLTPEEREGWDFAMEIAREAVGYPVSDQKELFTKEDRDEMRRKRLEAEGAESDDGEE